MSNRDVVIVAAKRTPITKYLGSLAPLSAPELGVIATKAAMTEGKIDPSWIQEVIVGNVLPAGEGQAPARQVLIKSGIPNTSSATTINKVCGSGLKAVMFGTAMIQSEDADVVLAGGMESMSRVPFYVEGMRQGVKFGDQKLVDGMIKDGLWDVYNDFHMGSAAELCARDMNISRQDQDAYAKESYRRAREAQASGKFKKEICPVEIPQKKGAALIVDTDDGPNAGDPSKFETLKPAFDKNGSVTAANASSLNDGAAMLVLMEKKFALSKGLKPLARIISHASAAQAPEWFTTAPAKAIQNALKKSDLQLSDIDLFEINEAFAVVSLANERLLGLNRDKVNVYGGAIALGHPIGASGARILVTLLSALAERNLRRGLASLCIGGGEGVALIVDREV